MAWVRAMRTRELIAVGILVGALIASSVVILSARRYEASSVALLGSGSGLSALVTAGTARLLIVSGDDPAAFANAYSDMRPTAFRRIDLVVIAPAASEAVATRAVEISSPRRLYRLGRNSSDQRDTIAGHVVRPMDGPSSIALSDSMQVSLDPGTSHGWQVTVEDQGATVVLAERVPLRPHPAKSLVAVMGESLEESAMALGTTIVASWDAVSASDDTGETVEITLVNAGSAIRIQFGNEALQIRT